MNRNLTGRLKALEKKQGLQRENDCRSWLQDAICLSEEACKELLALMPTEENSDAAIQLLQSNLDRLTWCALKGYTLQAGCVNDFLRWPAALARLVGCTPEEMRATILDLIFVNQTEVTKPVGIDSWLTGLSQQRSRLPADIAPGVMTQLLTILLEQQHNNICPVCDGCGLQRPERILSSPVGSARFFACCPHCNCREWTWNTLTDNCGVRWKELDN
jgi:hypothetical protein